jgi:hypothetical protein
MLAIGMTGVYWKLDKVNDVKSTSTVILKVSEFENVLSKSKIPDTLLTRPVFTKLYGYYSESRPTVLVDSFYAKLDQKEIVAMKLDNYKQEMMDMKTRCDQIVLKNEKDFEKTIIQGSSFLDVLIAMCLAGLLGGVLANLRGFFEFIRDEETKVFPEHLKIPYIIRPFTGMLSGMLVFFLTSVLISTSTVSLESHFIPFKAMVTFMGIAILAGFASQEFTEKLKSAASVLFGSAPPPPAANSNPAPKENKSAPKGGPNNDPIGYNLESIIEKMKPEDKKSVIEQYFKNLRQTQNDPNITNTVNPPNIFRNRD